MIQKKIIPLLLLLSISSTILAKTGLSIKNNSGEKITVTVEQEKLTATVKSGGEEFLKFKPQKISVKGKTFSFDVKKVDFPNELTVKKDGTYEIVERAPQFKGTKAHTGKFTIKKKKTNSKKKK